MSRIEQHSQGLLEVSGSLRVWFWKDIKSILGCLLWPLLLSASASVQFSSVAQSCLTLWPHGLQHARLPCPSPTPRACLNSHPSSWWCHPTISSSVVPFASCLQSYPASMLSPVSQFFTSGGQSIGVSASASVLPMYIQDWFPLGLTSLISSQSRGHSRVFSKTAVQKHQFFSAQLSLWSNSHIIHDYWKNRSFDYD